MLAWILLLVGLIFAASTATEHVIVAVQLHDRVDVELAHSVTEFRQFAAGHSEVAGQPSTDVRSLLESAQRDLVPDGHEVFAALLDGQPLNSTQSDLAAQLSHTTRIAQANDTVFGEATTEDGHVRYAAVPVSLPSSPVRGTFVVATFPDEEYSVLMAGLRMHTAIGVGALALATAVGWLIAGRLVRPLRMLRDTAASVTQSDLSWRIPVHGHDEIADVAETFNMMLNRLEGAFSAQRQLISDIGHELRTPITIVRGQLDAITHNQMPSAEAIAVADDELDRMNRMVGDLLVLAKAGQPDFLNPQQIELSEVIDEIYVKASGLAPSRMNLDAPRSISAVFLSADRHRITQAVIQLADNAVRHTPPDSEIWIGAQVRGAIARIWVRDNGPGVPPGQQEQVFERFRRGNTSQDQDGVGLGLAIVAAIAEAHSGRVYLDDQQGSGAMFVLELPIVPYSSVSFSSREHPRD